MRPYVQSSRTYYALQKRPPIFCAFQSYTHFPIVIKVTQCTCVHLVLSIYASHKCFKTELGKCGIHSGMSLDSKPLIGLDKRDSVAGLHCTSWKCSIPSLLLHGVSDALYATSGLLCKATKHALCVKILPFRLTVRPIAATWENASRGESHYPPNIWHTSANLRSHRLPACLTSSYA